MRAQALYFLANPRLCRAEVVNAANRAGFTFNLICLIHVNTKYTSYDTSPGVAGSHEAHMLASPCSPATRVHGAPFVSAYSYRARSAALSSSSRERTSAGTLRLQSPEALPAELSASTFCPSMAGERPSACHSIAVELFKVSVVRTTSKLSKTWRASACRQ